MSEMKERSKERIRGRAAVDGGGYQDINDASWSFSDAGLQKFAAAIIKADRALNAPTPPAEQQSHADLIAVLRGGRQCDEEGVEIIMSRQACVEAANLIEGAATHKDVNSYCLILRELGMEEEGDPVAEVMRLKRLVEQQGEQELADRDVMRQAVTALECARDGLLWYQDLHPEDHSGADDEMHTLIDGAIAMLAAAPTPPAAQPSYTHADVTDAHAKGYALGLAQKDRPAERQDSPQDVEVIELISQRDHREEIIDQLCDAVLGPDRQDGREGMTRFGKSRALEVLDFKAAQIAETEKFDRSNGTSQLNPKDRMLDEDVRRAVQYGRMRAFEEFAVLIEENFRFEQLGDKV